jgi:hypothetical protein
LAKCFSIWGRAASIAWTSGTSAPSPPWAFGLADENTSRTKNSTVVLAASKLRSASA